MAFGAVASYVAQRTRGYAPQTQKVALDQVENKAGGYVWRAPLMVRLRRFLILGTEGGSYYSSEKDLTLEGKATIEEALAEDAQGTISMIRDISLGGQAPKNDPCILALAIAAASTSTAIRRMALDILPLVARIPTHLFQFMKVVRTLRGEGRMFKRAIQKWLASRTSDELVFTFSKYAQREGMSKRDLLRIVHPDPVKMPAQAQALAWMSGAYDSIIPRELESAVAPGEQLPKGQTLQNPDGSLTRVFWKKLIYPKFGAVLDRVSFPIPPPPKLDGVLRSVKMYAGAGEWGAVASLIREYNLPREVIPTEGLNSPDIWMALLEKMPPHALLRNLGKMSSVGILNPFSKGEDLVVNKLGDVESLRKKRVHPMNIFVALNAYTGGKALSARMYRVAEANVWRPSDRIKEALTKAFSASFGWQTPTGKRIVLAIDVSGSMHSGVVAGTTFTPSEAAGAMAWITAKIEPSIECILFATEVREISVPIRGDMTELIGFLGGVVTGGTNCAAPALWLLRREIKADALVLYTDNETWAGNIHAFQALGSYRERINPELRSSCVSLVANAHTLGSPNDGRHLDLVGFDTNTPHILSEFISGRI